MQPSDLLAVRPGVFGEADSASPPVDTPASAEKIEARETRGARWRRVGAAVAITTGAHALIALAFLWLWHAMWTDLGTPEPIAVEIVHDIPGEANPAPAPAAPKPEPPKPEPPKPEPPQPEPPKPEPATPAPADPLPPPPMPPANQTEALKEALKGAALEPPEEARPAASQSEVNQLGNSATVDAADKTAAPGTPDAQAPAADKPAPPPPAPEALTTARSDTTVPAPSTAPDPDTPPTSGEPTPSSAVAKARLAAALPMSSGLPMPSSFRAALTALGTSSSANYRGSVFGALSRARGAVDEEARAAHLTGQVVLGIVLKPDGNIETLSVLQSSGHDASDAFAIAMVRRAAPFPPPPPGASRAFNPVITFGDS